jgi:hypothetical protein
VNAYVYLINFGDTGPGDFVFVGLWAILSLLLVSYYVYKMTQR